jgi:hypothetical protein
LKLFTGKKYYIETLRELKDTDHKINWCVVLLNLGYLVFMEGDIEGSIRTGALVLAPERERQFP